MIRISHHSKYLHLFCSEAFSRILGYFLLYYLSHHLSLAEFGFFSLAQSLGVYALLLIDAGTKPLATRIVARDPSSIALVRRLLLGKRSILTGVAVALGGLYVLFLGGKSGFSEGHLFLFTYILSFVPCCLLTDWIFLGTSDFKRVGWSKWLSSFLVATISVLLVQTGLRLYGLSVANLASWIGINLYFLHCWKRSSSRDPPEAFLDAETTAIRKQLTWGPILAVGLTQAFNQFFVNFDIFLIKALIPDEASSLRAVGLYHAAYKLILIPLASYYLVLVALYPKLSLMKSEDSNRRALVSGLKFFAAGLLVASAIYSFRDDIVRLVYSEKFSASGDILALLCWAIPLDCLSSFLGNYFMATGQEKKSLVCIGMAMLGNIALNFVWIPRYGGSGAAMATLGSYFVLIALQLFSMRKTLAK